MTEPSDSPQTQPGEPVVRPEANVEPHSPPAAAGETVADDKEHPLDPRYVTLQRIAGWIVTAAVSFGAAIAIPIVSLSMRLEIWKVGVLLLGWLAATTCLALWGHYWPGVEHRYRSYRVNERGIEIRGGVIWRKTVTVPRSRVQHTDVSQGPLERRFGLGTLVIHTAGTEHSMVNLPGLEHGIAARIRDHLVAGGEDDAV